jgi:hypothetical protein
MTSPSGPTVCVYTIVGEEVVAAALGGDGSGEFLEGRRWATAHRCFEERQEGEPFPLLLGDASTTRGVEWVAQVESIELLASGETRVSFSGFTGLGRPVPLSKLRKLNDGEPLSTSYQRPYVPCQITGATRGKVTAALADTGTVVAERALALIGRKSKADYVAALRSVESKMTSAHRAMLTGHAKAAGNALSMMKLARLGGYESFASANLQYGRLGRLVADALGVQGLINQVQSIATAYSEERDEQGHFVWVLRDPVIDALRELGWITATADDLLLSAASRAVDADPRCRDLAATTRQAIIEARVGQGAYRSSLMELWDGRCALTGCSIPSVLIASHAKPWSQSTNEERLDPYNGLLLAAQVDRLFDAGLIAFSDEGRLLLSPEVAVGELQRLGLREGANLRKVHRRHKPYLSAHRKLHGFER